MERNEYHWKDVSPKFNRSYTYIFPILGQSRSQFLNVKACFIGDEDKTYKNHIFLLHDFSGNIEFSRYEKSLLKHPQFVEQYSPDEETDMFVFSVPDIALEDYGKIIESKYSKVSNKYKHHIIRFHSPYIGKIENKMFYKVLYRHSDIKKKIESDFNVKLNEEAEVSSLMNMNKEIFRTWMKVPNIL